MAMTPKENWMALLNHEKTDGIPLWFAEERIVGGACETFECGPLTGGFDGFGCNWIPTESAGGQGALDPTIIVLEDVLDWEDVVKFPDLDAFDWETYAEQQLAGIDRETEFVEYNSWHSTFLRLTHLMGFENALCAFYEEPEATHALCEAITDFKIRSMERNYEYLKPDGYIHYDDVATERSLFMSPEIYREFIKPCHKRLNDAAREMGMIPSIHVCGYCEDIIPDLIDEGSMGWQSAQPVNDLEGILEKYGDRLAVIGGYDTQGRPASFDVTDEEIAAEVKRCFETFGRFGRSYSLQGFFLGASDDPAVGHRYEVMFGTAAMLNAELRG